MESKKKKEKVSEYCGHKIMKHFKILLRFDSPNVKWYIKSSTKNIVYELPNDLVLVHFGSNYIKSFSSCPFFFDFLIFFH